MPDLVSSHQQASDSSIIQPTQNETTSYEAFLATKILTDIPTGIEVPIGMLPSVLFDWQAVLVQWALRRGRAAIFANTGLGKTLQQLAFSMFVPGRVLIVAPLAVAQQTIREARNKLDIDVRYVKSQADMQDGISITNYDRLDAFQDVDVTGIVLDESSILKGLASKTREMLVKHFTHIPFRLCCTATPAPNDISEIANHAEFLGIMTRTSMLSTFFVHDDDGWRLRGHAKDAFFRWLSSWGMALRSPEDIGYNGDDFLLPPLSVVPHFLPLPYFQSEELFPGAALKGITDRIAVRQQTAEARAEYAADLAKLHDGPVLIWTGLNVESSAVTHCLKDQSVCEVVGSDSQESKEHDLLGFIDGASRILVSKASICGHGLNFQHCHMAIFCGLGDSWEIWFQAVRRIWRYGQHHPVTVHVVISEHEKPIWDNIQRKEREAMAMIDGLIESAQAYQEEALADVREHATVSLQHHSGHGWELWEGDCVQGMAHIPDSSVHLSITSPPFISLYQYSPTERDIGNCTSEAQFFEHFGYVADQLLRITVPGRLVAMHVSDVPAMQVRDGWIGLKNFSGHMIDHMVGRGWLFHGKYIVDKCPQAQAIRIRAKGLAFQQLHKDSSWMRGALPDYILLFRKPGDNPVNIVPDIDNETWIEWAHPVWYSTSRDAERGIRETYTLNASEAREHDDDRHICPLALDLIERCVRLWSNPGELIFDPFAGLCSTGYVALQYERQFVGCELKHSYAESGIRNLNRALTTKNQLALFG